MFSVHLFLAALPIDSLHLPDAMHNIHKCEWNYILVHYESEQSGLGHVTVG